jgi:hypothetical protein
MSFLDYLHSSRQMTTCRPTEYKQFALMSYGTHRLKEVITCSGHSDILEITLSHKIYGFNIGYSCNSHYLKQPLQKNDNIISYIYI